MTALETTTTVMELPHQDAPLYEAQLEAAAFLARYSGRTLDACRHDLRCSSNGLRTPVWRS